jgi:hypothetical protein
MNRQSGPHAACRSFLHSAQRRERVRHECEDEGAASAFLALHSDVTAMQLRQSTSDGQAEACPHPVLVLPSVDLHKRLK